MQTSGFGWQGFYLEHPADWAPVALNGNRAEGYARLNSSGRLALQIRWKKASSGEGLRSRLGQYFSGLERDAKKRKEAFRRETEEEDGGLVYKWQGAAQGRGKLFFNEACSRVFFLEIVAGRNDSVLPTFRSVTETFRSSAGELEDWSVFGLAVRLPSGFAVEKKLFHAGKTHLTLSRKGVKVTAERWGLAEQLLAKHKMEDWAKSVLGLKEASLSEEPEGLRLRQSTVLRGVQEALVKHDPKLNQLTLVKTESRKTEWSPQWEWLV